LINSFLVRRSERNFKYSCTLFLLTFHTKTLRPRRNRRYESRKEKSAKMMCVSTTMPRFALMNDTYVSVIIVSISVERIRCSTDEHEHHNTDRITCSFPSTQNTLSDRKIEWIIKSPHVNHCYSQSASSIWIYYATINPRIWLSCDYNVYKMLQYLWFYYQ